MDKGIESMRKRTYANMGRGEGVSEGQGSEVGNELSVAQCN